MCQVKIRLKLKSTNEKRGNPSAKNKPSNPKREEPETKSTQ